MSLTISTSALRSAIPRTFSHKKCNGTFRGRILTPLAANKIPRRHFENAFIFAGGVTLAKLGKYATEKARTDAEFILGHAVIFSGIGAMFYAVEQALSPKDNKEKAIIYESNKNPPKRGFPFGG